MSKNVRENAQCNEISAPVITDEHWRLHEILEIRGKQLQKMVAAFSLQNHLES